MRPEPRPHPGPAPLHDGGWINPIGGPLIRVATGCASVDELVHRFAKFASEGALVLPASARLTVGTEGRFAIVLRDRSVAMHGRCRVTAATPAALSASRPGVHRTMLRLALLDMDETTRAVHARLLMAQHPPVSQPAPDRASPPAPPRGFEARAPRAPLTLPANPFSQLGANDLASFVECTLFEANPEGEETVADRPVPAAHQPPPIPVVVAARSPMADPVPATPSSRAPVPPPTRAAITATRIALCAACVIAGVGVGLIVRPPAAAPPRRADADSRVQVARETRAPAPPVTQTPAPPAPPLVEAIAPPVEAPSAAGDSTAPVVDGCSVRVVTEPGHAEVLWDGVILGRTPLEDAPVACGTATVTIRREHFQPVTREITAEPGSPTNVTQQLQRRTGTLLVGSSPPGAQITVNGRALGPAPARLEVTRYGTVEIQATLPGYVPWTKSLYVRQPETRVGMKLVPVRGADVVLNATDEANIEGGVAVDQP